MAVDNDHPYRPGYELKLNSYDLAVDIELADAIQRLRFEHPEVRAVIVASLKERIFCAGANLMMLRGSSHCAKVNFCKFTNETRFPQRRVGEFGPRVAVRVPRHDGRRRLRARARV
jgi:benzoyl-CoA-dihydrodiol lyase